MSVLIRNLLLLMKNLKIMGSFWLGSFIISATLAILCNFMCSYLMDTYDTAQVKKALEYPSSRQTLKQPLLHPGVRLAAVQFPTALEELFGDLSNLLFTLFNTAFGMVIIPILGRNFVTITLHSVVLVAAFSSFVLRFFMVIEKGRNFFEEFQFAVYLLLTLYVIQLITAFSAVIIPERFLFWRKEELFRQHGMLGVIIFLVLLWNFFLHLCMINTNRDIIKSSELNETGYYLFQLLPWLMVAIVYLYVLLVMCLVLMPIDEMSYEYNRTTLEES